METDRIIQTFEGKIILITGCTGFLGKILLEKILRVVANVKKLYLLIRSSNVQSAEDRLHKEVIETELFQDLRKKWGENISSILSEKVIPISGDVSHANLGITDPELMDGMFEEIDFIINSAATTRFDERYDVAMDINVSGPLNVLEFAKRCSKLKLLLHVSTAFVNGTRSGVLKEEAFQMGATLEGAKASYLDIQAEKNLANHAQNIDQRESSLALRNLGILRANLHGWADTYTYTKAMGEMVLGHFKDNIPLIILRPTIITSTHKEPFPGWSEGVKTLDAIFVPYFKGQLRIFPCDLDAVLDVIPGDMVVNCMLVAMAMHQNKSQSMIYHVGTSQRNPIKIRIIGRLMYEYCKENPLSCNAWNPTRLQRLKSFDSMPTCIRYLRIRFLPFLAILKVLNVIFCNYFESSYATLRRRMDKVVRLAELYQPYVFYRRIFDDANTQNLRMAARRSNENEAMFDFDPDSINWEEYFINIHFPGIVKYVMKLRNV